MKKETELVLLDEEDIHATMGFINSAAVCLCAQTLKSGSKQRGHQVAGSFEAGLPPESFDFDHINRSPIWSQTIEQ